MDVVVGDFSVGTCELLIGIPALKKMQAMIDCDAGTMSFIDDGCGPGAGRHGLRLLYGGGDAG